MAKIPCAIRKLMSTRELPTDDAVALLVASMHRFGYGVASNGHYDHLRTDGFVIPCYSLF